MDKWKQFRVKKDGLINNYIFLKKRQFFLKNFVMMSKLKQIIEIIGANYDR